MTRLLLACAALAMLALWAEATLVDIEPQAYFIVSRHNQERRSGQLRASDMMEMRWDEGLAQRAAQWSEQCQYKRPPRSGVNSNLYFETDHVFGKRAVHRMIKSALQSWSRAQNRFSYSTNCGRACSYVQMITARTDRIGCALSTCEDLKSGNFVAEYASMLVCFYSPGTNLMNSLPYTEGQACSRCSRGMECRSGLCAQPGTYTVPRDLQQMADEQRRRPSSIILAQDKLNRNESYYLLDAHNKMREAQRDRRLSARLDWDPYLERWAEWVSSCIADFPGPQQTYTNFDRLDQGSSTYDTVSAWAKEGYNKNLQLAHGCRTPDDKMRCNHFTNILEPRITSMACAARDCKDGTRQLICLYDNREDRSRRDQAATDALARLEVEPRRRQPIIDSRRPSNRDRRPTNTDRASRRPTNTDRASRRPINTDRSSRRPSNTDRSSRRPSNTDRSSRRPSNRDRTSYRQRSRSQQPSPSSSWDGRTRGWRDERAREPKPRTWEERLVRY